MFKSVPRCVSAAHSLFVTPTSCGSSSASPLLSNGFLFQCCFAFPIPSPLMTFWFLNILFARCCSYALSFFGP